MPMIHEWANHPDKVLDVADNMDDDELKKALAWALTEGDDLADELITKIMNVFVQPGDKAAAVSLAHGIELALDAYYKDQEGV